MLADRQHPQPADLAAMDLGDELGGGRHVAIFHRGPEHAVVLRRALDDPAASSSVVASGFSHRICSPASNSGCEHRAVREIGQATITASTSPARRQRRRPSRTPRRPRASPSAAFARASDAATGSASAVTTAPGVIAQVVDVLDPHHAGADQPITDLLSQRSCPICTTMSEIILTPESRPLGKSGIAGLRRSPGACGASAASTWPGGRALVEAALAAGVTLFDTADIYGFDAASGSAMPRRCSARSSPRPPGLRDRMVLATKGGIRIAVPYDSSPRLSDATRSRLRCSGCGVERIDLYQIHRPDILAHPHESRARARGDGRCGQGRARRRVELHARADARARGFLTIPLATTQPEFSPLATGADDRRAARSGDEARSGGARLVAARRRADGGDAPRTTATTRGRRGARCARRRSGRRARPRPMPGSWRIRRGRSRSSARRTPRGSPRSPTPTRSASTRAEWYDVLVAVARGEAAVSGLALRDQLVLGVVRRRLRVSGRARPQAEVELGTLPRHRAAGGKRRVRQHPAAPRAMRSASTPPPSPPRSRRC